MNNSTEKEMEIFKEEEVGGGRGRGGGEGGGVCVCLQRCEAAPSRSDLISLPF